MGSFEQASAILAALRMKSYLFRAELAPKQATSDSSSPIEGGSGTAEGLHGHQRCAAELPLPDQEVAAVGVVISVGIAELVEVVRPLPDGQVRGVDVAVVIEIGVEDRLVHHLKLDGVAEVFNVERQSRWHARNIGVVELSDHGIARDDVECLAQRRHEGHAR